MNSFNKFFLRYFLPILAVLLMALAISHAADINESIQRVTIRQADHKEEDRLPSFAELGRHLVQYNHRATMTCTNFPRICRAKGSPGPDCCRKQCVNVMTDRLNCGQCGRKCRYGEACCGGQCVNVMYDRRNCGACHRRCKKGSYCRYGMCSYA